MGGRGGGGGTLVCACNFLRLTGKKALNEPAMYMEFRQLPCLLCHACYLFARRLFADMHGRAYIIVIFVVVVTEGLLYEYVLISPVAFLLF